MVHGRKVGGCDVGYLAERRHCREGVVAGGRADASGKFGLWLCRNDCGLRDFKVG